MLEHALHWALIHFSQLVVHIPFLGGGGGNPPPCGMGVICG
jgi:hypothetical protein